ncbi:aspartate kinase [Virgibacillus byunsanensis]|uniref:Aspartokinase n=1 Tax=Virgibacillus byunsanensis TaxID=570945 RepID=A0ABW3LQK0_9BACI
MKVSKFGGSSVASAEQLVKVGAIINDDSKRKFIVVSAPGKRFKGDEKITDLLIQLGESYISNQPFDNVLDKILTRFSGIINELNISNSVLDDINQTIQSILSKQITDERKMDALKSVGEDSSAKILSQYLKSLNLNASYLNPKDAGIIVSNEPGRAQILPQSFEKLYALRERNEILVIPGFFGYTEDEQLVTFSRGGSDITGSIVAAGVKADLYENFTDVDSVYSVNPQIVQDPIEITSLTYREMRELSYAGFSVFHDEALIPAFKENIPVCIKNTNNPTSLGTMIVASKKHDKKCVVGIASAAGFCSLYVSKYLMNREVGFGRKLLQILEDEDISFEHAPSGIDDMSVIIRESQLTAEKENSILKRVKEELNADMVTFHRNLAMIMIVGEGIMSTIGIAQKATTAITEADVNIEMINQGSSEVSIMFGIRAEGINRAIQSLYTAFFE